MDSDRHHLDASTWKALLDKIRFNAYSGTQDNDENFAFLPTKILNLGNNFTSTEFAQFNYNIKCHPLETDEDSLPTKYFRVIDDFSKRIQEDMTLEEFEGTRFARFEIDQASRDQERSYRRNVLDVLMEQIPGLDNYQGNLTGQNIHHADWNRDELLDTSRYHRSYKVAQKGAMGGKLRNRGFADQNVFMARTTQERVASMRYTDCRDEAEEEQRVCTEREEGWSYAIPLEIIYMTPLYNWNPYNILYHEGKGPDVDIGGRNGSFTPERAYDGNRRNIYYRTPAELFTDLADSALAQEDTDKGVAGVLDNTGRVRRVVASGTRIMLPKMTYGDGERSVNLGEIRTRYPIAPIYNDGSQIYKELEALKDVVMDLQKHTHLLHQIPSILRQGDCTSTSNTEDTSTTATNDIDELSESFSLMIPAQPVLTVTIPKSQVEAMMRDILNCVNSYEEHENTRTSAGNWQNRFDTGSTMEGCRTLCNQDVSCLAYDWQNNNLGCKLHNATSLVAENTQSTTRPWMISLQAAQYRRHKCEQGRVVEVTTKPDMRLRGVSHTLQVQYTADGTTFPRGGSPWVVRTCDGEVVCPGTSQPATLTKITRS